MSSCSVSALSEGGAKIEIAVTEIRGDSVRLGVKAPADVVVNRREIWEEKRQETAA
jgi:carbon storage regulator CsrA